MEEQNNIVEPKKEKGKKGLIIGLIIAFVLIASIIIVLLIVKPAIFKSKTDNSNKSTDNEIVIKPLDLEKCLNSSDLIYSNPTDKIDNLITAKINSDSESITVTLTDEFQNNVSIKQLLTSSTKEYTITGFDKKIKSVFVGEVGQSITGMGIFSIMEDNTVTYVRLFEKKLVANNTIDYFFTLDNNQYKIRYVDEAYEVIKLYQLDAHLEQGSGHVTIIGAKADGSFYDLGINYEKDQPQATGTPTQTETKEETKEETRTGRIYQIGTVKVDLDKCKNNDDKNVVYDNPSNSTSQANGLSVAKNDEKSLVITIDFAKYGRLCKPTGCKYSDGEVRKYTITDYNKITDYILGGRGQDFTSSAIYYLDDSIGSAHIAKLYNRIKGSGGTISMEFIDEPKANVVLGHDMIGLFNVSVNTKRASAGGYQTTIGVLEDGSFYDLGLWLDRNEQLNN